MSEDRKKTTVQAPPPQGGKPKPEAAGEREDFPDGWSPWKDWDLPPSIRHWEPEGRETKHRHTRRRPAARLRVCRCWRVTRFLSVSVSVRVV